MQVITEDYRRLNAELHANGNFGIAGDRHSKFVRQTAGVIRAKTVLDYGSGTARWIERDLKDEFDVRSYDPCVPEISDPPEPADLIVCTDVLEHIEPECLDAVLDDIKRCTLRIALILVSTKPALKTLSDGRNAHLIQKPAEWWLPHLIARWRIANFAVEKNGFYGIFARAK